MGIEIARLADVLVDVADTLVADFDLIEFLHQVAGHATAITDGVAAGVVLIGHDGALHHVGASSENAQHLEFLQLQNAEGPCLDSFRTGRPVVVPDLALTADRWPSFTPRALEVGVVAVHAFPMRLRDKVIGGLNIFQTRRDELTETDVRVLQALADMATISLIQEQAISRAGVLTEQLQVALNSRIVVEQAKGATARAFGVSVEDAFQLLRDHARSSRRRLTDVAHDVVASPEGPRLLRAE